mgnify:FL=1
MIDASHSVIEQKSSRVESKMSRGIDAAKIVRVSDPPSSSKLRVLTSSNAGPKVQEPVGATWPLNSPSPGAYNRFVNGHGMASPSSKKSSSRSHWASPSTRKPAASKSDSSRPRPLVSLSPRHASKGAALFQQQAFADPRGGYAKGSRRRRKPTKQRPLPPLSIPRAVALDVDASSLKPVVSDALEPPQRRRSNPMQKKLLFKPKPHKQKTMFHDKQLITLMGQLVNHTTKDHHHGTALHANHQIDRQNAKRAHKRLSRIERLKQQVHHELAYLTDAASQVW